MQTEALSGPRQAGEVKDPIYATASDLAAAIRERRLSSREVVQAHLDQIAKHNGPINAVVTLDAEGALQRAYEADEALARGEVWGPLHGVPITIKDWYKVKGMRSTAGLPQLANHVPDEDALVVARVRAAGTVIMGKTNTPGEGGGYHTGNPVFGLTNNPLDLGRSPGGSSGGSAAAVAAGLTPFDVGSDAGGSLRVPAHYCGVYTIKPTERRIPTAGHLTDLPVASSLRLINAPGPLARSVDDLVLGLTIMEGPGGGEWEVPPTKLASEGIPAQDHFQLAWCDDFGVPVTRDTSRVLSTIAQQLDDAGHRIEHHGPDIDSDLACQAWGGLFAIGAGLKPSNEQPFGLDLSAEEPIARGMNRVLTNKLTEYIALAEIRDELIGRLECFFERHDALLCPVTVGPAILHYPQGAPIPVDDQSVSYWRAGVAYTAPFNLTGHPSVVIPAGQSAEGLPIGVQIVGPRWHEMTILSIARRIETLIGPFRRPPGL